MAPLQVHSPEIARASLHSYRPIWTHAYTTPFILLYPLLAYAYYVKYSEWLGSEEWTFVATVGLTVTHALSFLVTRWSVSARTLLTCRSASTLKDAECVCIFPLQHRGKPEIVPLVKKDARDLSSYSFTYNHETYSLVVADNSFAPTPFPCVDRPTLGSYLTANSLTPKHDIAGLHAKYGPNGFDIPIPKFIELFVEHAVAPFFVFQVFCVGLWMLDEYWYYSLFTLFMLVVFECTVVFQRVKTLQEFRTMSVKPYPIQVLRDGKWTVMDTDKLYPGDIVSITRCVDDRAIPADLLLLSGTVIVNEAMLSGESTPLVKESIQLREPGERLDLDGSHRGSVVFGGTKALQCSVKAGEGETVSTPPTPDNGALATVLRTGFGTAQGRLVRTMIFSTERVSANSLESFLFIGFLLIFAIAASWYVWTKGIERDMAKGKLLLDCVLIITSVVPPELPMELSLAVNASLVALSKFAIFCTEPFRIPFAGKVDVCCFDKTGTITQESLVLDGVAGVMSDPRELVPVSKTAPTTILCLAAAHALVRLDDGTVVGDPMERATLEALGWELDPHKMDVVVAKGAGGKGPVQSVTIRRRFQFSSALKRMGTVASVGGRTLVSVKGAPETIRTMLSNVPESYDATYKWFTRRGARVLALGWKEMAQLSTEKVNKMHREEFESSLNFGGFLVFQCPLKEDAVATLKMLGDSSHRCIMITGDNPLTAVHVAREVEIVDRDALILDLKEGTTDPRDLVWRTVDESKIIPVDPDADLDPTLLNDYDICITGAALAFYSSRPTAMAQLVQHTLVYARVSPSQKETILATLNSLGYTTLMAGDGTNDVGALKCAHVGVALLEGTIDDLKKIEAHQRLERIKKVYESQLGLTQRFGQPPPPVPPALRDAYPELVQARESALEKMKVQQKKDPMQRFDFSSITDKLADMDDEDVPKIKLGDASCAAPFTSKLSNVAAIAHIIRQGRCTLVATIQMYKILALNCLISAYSLSVLYLDGIKFGDYQVTINGMLMSVCFLFISRAKPVEQLSRERPLTNIFNLYVVLSVLLQFAVHIAALLYITDLSNKNEERGPIDLEAKFEPSLLNTAIYLLGLSQQVSTFAINFQGRPFRESIRENPALYYGLVGASAVAFGGALDLMPELNRWLQIVEMTWPIKMRLTTAMAVDFALCFIIEHGCKALFADLSPREFVSRGIERRLRRRAAEREARLLEMEQKKDQ